jgi:hypothetical protein
MTVINADGEVIRVIPGWVTGDAVAVLHCRTVCGPTRCSQIFRFSEGLADPGESTAVWLTRRNQLSAVVAIQDQPQGVHRRR